MKYWLDRLPTAAYPNAVVRLLLSSFLFVIGRSAALPFIAIYLTQRVGVSTQMLGLVLGGSVFVATLFGLYAGYLNDRRDKRKMLLLACALLALACVGLSVSFHAALAFLALSAFEVAVTLRSISLKALLADWLPQEQRRKAFALNYTLINMAFSLGPLMGAWVFHLDVSAPLWLAAGAGLVTAAWANPRTLPAVAPHAAPQASAQGFAATLNLLRNDLRLVWLTLAGILTAMVFGRVVTGFLSQFLIHTRGTSATAAILPAILLTNTAGVVLMQYPVSRHIRDRHLYAWVLAGVSCYVTGLLGFMHCESLGSWIVCMAIFTVGEVIMVPVDYMFIDRIAPANKRGSYYGAQSLNAFGASVSPILCGFMLEHFTAGTMFGTLSVLALASLGAYYAGMHAPAPRQVAQGHRQVA